MRASFERRAVRQRPHPRARSASPPTAGRRSWNLCGTPASAIGVWRAGARAAARARSTWRSTPAQPCAGALRSRRSCGGDLMREHGACARAYRRPGRAPRGGSMRSREPLRRDLAMRRREPSEASIVPHGPDRCAAGSHATRPMMLVRAVRRAMSPRHARPQAPSITCCRALASRTVSRSSAPWSVRNGSGARSGGARRTRRGACTGVPCDSDGACPALGGAARKRLRCAGACSFTGGRRLAGDRRQQPAARRPHRRRARSRGR
jgi:hypothetical protein